MVQKELRDKILRILSLIAGIIVLSGMGTLYSYSLYAPTLKIRLNYSETEVNVVAAIGDMGVYIGAIPVGWFYDRVGPTLTFIGSGISIFSGYFLMYSALKGTVSGNAFLVGIYFWIQAMGSVASFQAGLVTNVKNFPSKHRGKVTGMIVSAFGLSAAIVTQIYRLFFASNDDVDGFLLFLAVALSSLTLLGVLFIRYFPWTKETKEIELKEQTTSGTSETEDDVLLHSEENEDGKSPLTTNRKRTERANEKTDEKKSDRKDNDTAIKMLAEDNEESNEKAPTPKFGDLSGINLWKEPQFIMLFCVIWCVGGSGLMFINILGGLVKAWQITEFQISTFVIVLSFGNFIGRVIIGNTIDLVKKRVPAIMLLIPSVVLMGVCHVLLAFTSGVGVLLFGTIGTAMAYGGHFAAYLFCVNMYFGDKNYGQNVGWSGTCNIAPSFSGNRTFPKLSWATYFWDDEKV
jgi:MFS family permease